jgi:probable HAF family extracellular repeat protein
VGNAIANNGFGTAFLYSNGVMTDLNSLIPSGWWAGGAAAINDSGQIVCDGTNPEGQNVAFLLTPVPEPSTLALLGIGAVSLIGYAWRRRHRAHRA